MKIKQEFRYDKSRYNSAKKQAFQECMEYCLEHTYGNTLLNTELCKILGYNIENENEVKKFKSIMSRIKNALLEYGYVLKSISGIGYYILKPQHITAHCYRTYAKRSQRLLDKSLYVLEHTDNTQLEEARLEEYNNFKELNEQLIDSAEKMINNSRFYSRMDYYNSLTD